MQHPIDNNGVTEYVSEKQYLQYQTHHFRTKYPSLKITREHVDAIHEIVMKGEKLAEADEQGNPTQPEYLEMFGVILKDVESAKVNHLLTHQDEEKQKSKESQVFEITMADYPDTSEIDCKFNFTMDGCDIAEDATEGEIGNRLRRFLVAHEFSMYAIGDLANALQDRGCENVIDNMCAHMRVAESTVYGYMKVARSIPKSKRGQLKLNPTGVQEIVKARLSDDPRKDSELKEMLFLKASEDNLDSKEIRSLVSSMRQSKKQNKGKVIARFIVIPQEGKPYLLKKEPAFNDEEVLIDTKKGAYLDQIGEEKPKWIALETK